MYAHTARFVDRVKIVVPPHRLDASSSLLQRVDTLDSSSHFRIDVIIELNYTVWIDTLLFVSRSSSYNQVQRFLFLVFLTGYHGCWNCGLSSRGVRSLAMLGTSRHVKTVIIDSTTVTDWLNLVFGDVQELFIYL